jgi:hypothetical protein
MILECGTSELMTRYLFQTAGLHADKDMAIVQCGAATTIDKNRQFTAAA